MVIWALARIAIYGFLMGIWTYLYKNKQLDKALYFIEMFLGSIASILIAVEIVARSTNNEVLLNIINARVF